MITFFKHFSLIRTKYAGELPKSINPCHTAQALLPHYHTASPEAQKPGKLLHFPNQCPRLRRKGLNQNIQFSFHISFGNISNNVIFSNATFQQKGNLASGNVEQ